MPLLLWFELVAHYFSINIILKIVLVIFLSFRIHFLLGAFGFSFLPSGVTSFNTISISNEMSTNVTISHESIGNYNYLPLALLLIMQFFVTIGITTIPFMLTGEVFPFKWIILFNILSFFITLNNIQLKFQTKVNAMQHLNSWSLHFCSNFHENVL